MSRQIRKSKAEIPTIDVCLVTIETETGEFGFDTANQINVEPQVEEEDAVKLVVKGILRAQKPKTSTITGNEITLYDNVFNPDLVLALQGGKIIYDSVDSEKIVGYEPPLAGTKEKVEMFTLNAYSAQYDASGSIVRYEKISYPNCQGNPVAFGSEDGVFRAPEYVINSAPKNGQPPYRIAYVESLPPIVDEAKLGELEVVSISGEQSGTTKITVTPSKEEYTNKYAYKISKGEATLPKYGEVPKGYTPWDGKTEISATSDDKIVVIEMTQSGRAIAGGVATVQANS